MTRQERAQRVAEKLGLKIAGPYILRELDPNSANYAHIDAKVWNHLLDLAEEVDRLRKELEAK